MQTTHTTLTATLARARAVPFRVKALLSFAAVYFIWGTTYLGLRFAVETIPSLTMAGTRNTLCGLMFLATVWFMHGSIRPTREQMRMAFLLGFIMVLLNNGATSIAARMMPSGTMSLIISLVPLIMSLMEWARPEGKRPAWVVFVCLFAGTIGIGILVEPALHGTAHIRIEGVLLTLLAALCWSFGSMIVKYHPSTTEPYMAAGLQMLFGGIMTIGAGMLRGEWIDWSPALISEKSAWSFVYLVVFGSYIAYTAYLWLLRNVQPHYATNYAYINPVIAVIVGSWLGGEPLTTQTMIAAGVIVSSVALLALQRRTLSKANT